ncbi:MAG: hypothetical protein LAP39_25545 [Acidobacteriia bacterium]|nr:hypothetical protein [Terriglobia bacterium]
MNWEPAKVDFAKIAAGSLDATITLGAVDAAHPRLAAAFAEQLLLEVSKE